MKKIVSLLHTGDFYVMKHKVSLQCLFILVLVALLVLVATENHRLIARNRKLVRGIHEVVMNNSAHIPGYIEPEDVIKGIYIRELTRK